VKDTDVFQRIPANVLRPWLEKEQAEALRLLTHGVDTVAIYRAQGRALFIEHLLKLLTAAQSTR
jgi:hypothetical protein